MKATESMDLTPPQARELGRVLQRQKGTRQTIKVEQDALGRVLVTNSDSGREWRVGVRGGAWR